MKYGRKIIKTNQSCFLIRQNSKTWVANTVLHREVLRAILCNICLWNKHKCNLDWTSRNFHRRHISWISIILEIWTEKWSVPTLITTRCSILLSQDCFMESIYSIKWSCLFLLAGHFMTKLVSYKTGYDVFSWSRCFCIRVNQKCITLILKKLGFFQKFSSKM